MRANTTFIQRWFPNISTDDFLNESDLAKVASMTKEVVHLEGEPHILIRHKDFIHLVNESNKRKTP